MAALDFPSGPTIGTIYPSPAVSGQPQYTYDGEKWTSGTGFGNIYISDSAPAAPVGSLWWESDTGILYVRYYDGSSTQWVAIAGSPLDAVLYNTAQTLTAAQRSQARANIDVTKKNYIINGAMMVSQENGATAGTATGYYPVDQFIASYGSTTGVVSAAQVSSITPAGSPNRIRLTVTTADAAVVAGDNYFISCPIEGLRFADLQFGSANAKTVTVQFGVRAPAGTYCISLHNTGAARCYVAEYVIAAGEANIDVMKSVVIPGDTSGSWATDNTYGCKVRWGFLWLV